MATSVNVEGCASRKLSTASTCSADVPELGPVIASAAARLDGLVARSRKVDESERPRIL